MALVLPTTQFPAFSAFIRLTPQQRERLLGALRTITPKRDTQALSRTLAKDAGISASSLALLLDMLQGMYIVRLEKDISAEEFAQQICDFAASSTVPELKPPDSDWEPIRTSLAQLLDLDATVGVIAKAISVSFEAERLFQDGRVISDIRPIFARNLSEKPAAAVIIHTFRLKYYDVDSLKEFYVNLDSSDVKQLQETMQRAIDKEANLRQYFKDQFSFVDEAKE
jgi:hypothetical protein